MHLLRSVPQKLAHADIWYRSRNRPEGTAELGVWFRVPALQLTHTAVEPDEDDLLVSLLEIFCHGRLDESTKGSQSGRRCRSTDTAEELASRETMLVRFTERMV